MKNITKYLFMVLAGAYMFTACGDLEYPWAEFSMETVTAEGAVFLSYTNQNFFRDYLDEDGMPTDEEIELFVRVLGPPPAEDLTVTFEIDPLSTAVAGLHFTPAATEFTIEAGKSNGGIVFTLHEDAFTPGEVETLFIRLTGTSSDRYPLHYVADSTRYSLMQNCVLSIFIFDGDFDLYIDGDFDQATVVSGDPANNEVTVDPIWTGDCSVNLTLHDDGTLTGENQLTGGDFGPPFGFVEFEDINGGQVLNTCTGEFEFFATPTLTGGYWWGGEYHFEILVQDGKKSLNIVGHPEGFDKMEPVKRE